MRGLAALVAVTATTGTALAAEEVQWLEGLSHSELMDQLKDWGLDSVFGAQFQQVSLEGEGLLHATPEQLQDAFPGIPSLHWGRLTRKLAPYWAALEEERQEEQVVSSDGRVNAAGRRQLSGVPTAGDEFSGIHLDDETATLLFYDDNAIVRTADGLTLASGEVNVTADLRINGDIIHAEYQTVVDNVDTLLDSMDDVENTVDELVADTATLYASVESAQGSAALGMSRHTAAKSCRYILQMGGDAHNGQYWITRDGDEAPFLAYCDMGRGGLELVFKLVAGIGGDAYDLWNDLSNHDSYNQTSDMHPFTSNDHYISPRLNASFSSAGKKMNAVYASMLIGQREEARATFSVGATDDYMSWLARDNLVDSSWTDIYDTDYNYFSIEGHAAAKRYFYMNANYGGCASDAGWWVITGRTSGCSWETQNAQPMFLYSPYGAKAAADGGIDGWQQADTFVVAVDYDAVYDSCRGALIESGFRARDGQYWIDHDGNTSPQLVYCDMEHGGYEMVFKLVTAGAVAPEMFGDDAGDTDGYTQGCDLWTDETRDWPLVASRNVDIHDENGEYGEGEHYLSPFRHGAFDNTNIVVDHIEVRVITAENTVKYLHFSGMNDADYDDWFNLDYLHTASWNDMFDDENYNYFSIAGHTTAGRCWFANSNYGGCTVDAGWVVVAARDQDGCDWEDQFSYPDVMYSTGSKKSTAASYALADMLAVFYSWHTE